MGSGGFERPITAQEAVLQEMRRNILTGQWAPGRPIRQDAVAAELGVSRVPVREALKVLEGEGQVTSLPHRGYVVRELDAAELTEVYRLRDLLEAEAVREAVPRLAEEDLERMREAMTAMEELEPGDLAALSEQNRRFHLALFEAARMPRLLRFIRLLRDAADTYRARLYIDAEDLRRTCREHREIYAACENRNAEHTIERLRAHRHHTIEKLEELLQADTVG